MHAHQAEAGAEMPAFPTQALMKTEHLTRM